MESLCNSDSSENIKEALTILGDKWSALILKQLHQNPYRYSQFEQQLEGISSRTLTKRLDMLLEKNVIKKTQIKDSAHHTYELTKKGYDLDEVIHAMALWGKQHHS
ncbi:MAG: DNA-binding HxlR family transcriptional regulator [Candidatus Saccharimonadales bacterium]|jgi:DNA-binding HxlR family transcriptional regulator